MQPLRFPAQKTALSAWRRLELLAMVATIPAFYLAVLSIDRPLVVALYLFAFGASALVIRVETRATAQALTRVASAARYRLSVLLVFGLLLSATLPMGATLDVLIVRLATALLIVLRMGESVRPWFWWGELPRLLTLAIGVLGLCGLGFWWLEPSARTFGDGLWLAFTTAATVGYGDLVPTTPASKIFAVFVVLMGFAVLSLVTAAIAAMWVRTEERKIEKEILRDVHRQLLSLHDEVAAMRRDFAAKQDVK